MPLVLDLIVDNRAADKLWVHGIIADQAYEVLENPNLLLRNRKDRRASFLLLGRDIWRAVYYYAS